METISIQSLNLSQLRCQYHK